MKWHRLAVAKAAAIRNRRVIAKTSRRLSYVPHGNLNNEHHVSVVVVVRPTGHVHNLVCHTDVFRVGVHVFLGRHHHKLVAARRRTGKVSVMYNWQRLIIPRKQDLFSEDSAFEG